MMAFDVAEVPCRYTLVASEFVFIRSIYLKPSTPFPDRLYGDRGDRARIGKSSYHLTAKPYRYDGDGLQVYSMRSAVPHHSMLCDHVLCETMECCAVRNTLYPELQNAEHSLKSPGSRDNVRMRR